MDSQQYIYELVKAAYPKTDIAMVDQSRNFETDLIVLLEFISMEPTTDKDLSSKMDFEKLQVSVFNKDYLSAITAAAAIRTILAPVRNQYIREIEFDDRLHLFDKDIEIHRIITNYTIHTL